MPVLDYAQYAASPSGKAARKRAHVKWSAKRKAKRDAKPALIKPQALLKALANWTQP